MFGIWYLFSFDVGRSTLDVRCSSLETIPYGINATCEHLQNNLALMGPRGLVWGPGLFLVAFFYKLDKPLQIIL